MYNEDGNKVSFVRVLLRILLFVLIFILAIKLITFLFNKGKKNTAEDVMNSNLTVLKDAGVKVVKDDNFNLNVGESKTYKLQELVDNKQAEEIKDENDKACSNEESYVEITKTETEYRVKSYLSCDNLKKDKYTYLDVNTKEEITNQDDKTTETTTTVEPTTTTEVTTTTTQPTTQATTRKTTKKVTTTRRVTTTTQNVRTTTTIPSDKAKISFNTNGGNPISPVIVDKGVSVDLPIPTRAGYTFYRWEDSSGNVYGKSIKTNRNIVLIAKWR